MNRDKFLEHEMAVEVNKVINYLQDTINVISMYFFRMQ